MLERNRKPGLSERIGRRLSRLIGVEIECKPFVESLEQAYKTGWSNCPCVFVLSTGRVGTETLTALLQQAHNVEAVHEPYPTLIKSSFNAYMEGPGLGGDEKWKQVVLAARDEFILEANKKGKIYIETNNRMTYLAEILAAVFPASKFIHLHRHPYEVIRSAMRRGYYDNHAWDFARIRPRPGEELAGSWDSLAIVEKNAWYWSRVNNDAKTFLGSLGSERAFDLPATALFRQDRDVLEDLFTFLDLDMPSPKTLAKVLGKRLNKQREGYYPAPSEWSSTEIEMINKWISETASMLGYSV